MTTKTRPLSPHLSAYKFRITSALSILHRLTGVALSLGAVLLIGWILAIASGETAYQHFAGFAGSWFGQLIIAGFVFGFYYHLCNGIRHLFWDAGKGFEMSTARASGGAVVGASIGLTIVTWAFMFVL
ncbi:MAG: succinate dehydrogenase, cytochrome b556 subunit [Pseudomonadota bacterium]